MSHTIVVEEMQADDVNAVVQIYQAVFNGTYLGFGELAAGMGTAPGVPAATAPALFRAELDDLLGDRTCHGLFVARADAVVVGFAIAVLQPTAGGLECWLNDLGVGPAWQKQGIGRMLVEKVLDWAIQEKGAQACLLESGVRNMAAHQLFETLGFQPLSTVFWKAGRSP